MIVFACLKHWYTSLIFFGPIPIVGFWIWLNGRRQSHRDPTERDGHAPV